VSIFSIFIFKFGNYKFEKRKIEEHNNATTNVLSTLKVQKKSHAAANADLQDG